MLTHKVSLLLESSLKEEEEEEKEKKQNTTVKPVAYRELECSGWIAVVRGASHIGIPDAHCAVPDVECLKNFSW